MQSFSKLMRSPPNQTASPATPLKSAQSNPDVFLSPEYEDLLYTNSKKRKAIQSSRDSPSSSADFDSIQKMLAEIKCNQDTQYANVTTNINSLKQQNEAIILSNEEIKKSVGIIMIEQKELKSRVEKLEQKNENIDELKLQVDTLDRKLKESTVEIKNLSVDNNGQLLETIGKIHRALKLEFNPRDVKNTFRLPTKQDKPKTVVVEYASTVKKAELLAAVKNYNKINEAKFSSETIGIPGERRVLYINESLTKRSKQLHYQAREFVKRAHWKFCWTARGKIFIREDEETAVIEIKDVNQLHNIETNRGMEQ